MSDDREELNKARVRSRVGTNAEYVARPAVYLEDPIGESGKRFNDGHPGGWIRVDDAAVVEVRQ